MSRLALLVGAVPHRCTSGPVVRLLAGRWTLHVEHMFDSILMLNVQGYPDFVLEEKSEICLDVPTDVQVVFDGERGTEPFINVFAEKVA